MPLFSIVTPTYNRANLLPRMIESVMEQIFTDWELIIVDDASTDDTTSIIQKYLIDPRLKYLVKENSGAAHSRNVGAEIATGQYIVFLDSDDEVYHNWLERVSNLVSDDIGAICTAAKRVFSDGRTINSKLEETHIFGELCKVKFTAGSFFIKKDLFVKTGGYDILLASNHHTDLGYRVMLLTSKLNYKVVAIDEYLVQINVHEGERIRNNWQKVFDGGERFIQKHGELLLKKNTKGLSNFYGILAYSQYKLENKQIAVKMLLKSIQYNPFKLKSYLLLFRYLCH